MVSRRLYPPPLRAHRDEVRVLLDQSQDAKEVLDRREDAADASNNGKSNDGLHSSCIDQAPVKDDWEACRIQHDECPIPKYRQLVVFQIVWKRRRSIRPSSAKFNQLIVCSVVGPSTWFPTSVGRPLRLELLPLQVCFRHRSKCSQQGLISRTCNEEG